MSPVALATLACLTSSMTRLEQTLSHDKAQPGNLKAGAERATGRRLVAALVTEKLVNCFLDNETVDNARWAYLTSDNCDAKLQPRFKVSLSVPRAGSQIFYLDPEDVVDSTLILPDKLISHPADMFALMCPHVSDDVKTQIMEELKSSVENQALAYSCRRPVPSLASSKAIDWERLIIEGHASHPMHRTRMGLSEQGRLSFPAECGQVVGIRFIALPSNEAQQFGVPLSQLLGSWLPTAPEGYTIVPIHPGQEPSIRKLFPQALILNDERPAYAQTSIRSVSLIDVPYNMKLALNMQTTSALRTVSPYSVYNGPLVSEAAKRIAPPALMIIGEPGSIGINPAVTTNAKHLACVVREDPEQLHPEHRFIVCGALVERDEHGVPLVQRVFNLNTQAKRMEFLKKYVELFLDCFLPPMCEYGLAFEAHGQNTLARFSQDGNLIGFAIRDFGGICLHPETFARNAGFELKMREGSTTIGSSLTEVYIKFFHAGIQHHLHRLVRALGAHHDDSGWQLIRAELQKRLSTKYPEVLELWSAPTVEFKCLLTMRIEDKICDYVFKPIPNVLTQGLNKQ